MANGKVEPYETYFWADTFEALVYHPPSDTVPSCWIGATTDGHATSYSIEDMQEFLNRDLIVVEEHVFNIFNAAEEVMKESAVTQDVVDSVKHFVGKEITIIIDQNNKCHGILRGIDVAHGFYMEDLQIRSKDIEAEVLNFSKAFVAPHEISKVRKITKKELEFWVDKLEVNLTATGKEFTDYFDEMVVAYNKTPGLVSRNSSFIQALDEDLMMKRITDRRKEKENEEDVKKPVVSKIPKEYDPSLVNTDITPDEMARRIKIAMKKPERPAAISVLLEGTPGTGKSLAVHYIAEKLGMQVHSYKMSDLIHKYSGESEKAVAKAFYDAEKQFAILLIDEIEAIVSDRSKADKSWEVSKTNQVLQSMDEYQGLFFATTNNIERIDTAIRRRFLLKQKFNNLTGEQAKKLAKLFFPRRRLDGFEDGLYAPADFSTVKASLLFVEDSDINKEFLLKRLKKEAEDRNNIDGNKRPIGFLS